MATEIPFTAEASLTFPPDEGAAAVDRTFSYAGNFKTVEEKRYDLIGAGTKTVDLGAIPAAGAKAVHIEVAPDSSVTAAPVMVTFNGGGVPLEVAPGGGIMILNPKPVAGITAISLAYTTSATVRVRVLG